MKRLKYIIEKYNTKNNPNPNPNPTYKPNHCYSSFLFTSDQNILLL